MNYYNNNNNFIYFNFIIFDFYINILSLFEKNFFFK